MKRFRPRLSEAAAVRPAAFTLVELLVSMAVFALLMAGMFEMLTQTQKVFVNTRSQLGQFQQAEKAFQMMTRRVSEATLNPYWDYEYPGGDRNRTPTRYVRTSELHFVSGPTDELTSNSATATASNPFPVGLRATHSLFFQGPFGFHEPHHWDEFNLLLNSWGYYVELNEDTANRPAHAPASKVAARKRFRLMEWRVPAEENKIYTPAYVEGASTYHPYRWFGDDLGPSGANEFARPVAENIIALFLSPQTTVDPTSTAPSPPPPTDIAPRYIYDTREYQNAGGLTSGIPDTETTRHKLPPMVRITMIAIDEPSAIRFQSFLDAGNTGAGSQIQPLVDLFNGTLFNNAVTFETDLDQVEAALLDLDINYRVFSSTVRLRNARWSESD